MDGPMSTSMRHREPSINTVMCIFFEWSRLACPSGLGWLAEYVSKGILCLVCILGYCKTLLFLLLLSVLCLLGPRLGGRLIGVIGSRLTGTTDPC